MLKLDCPKLRLWCPYTGHAHARSALNQTHSSNLSAASDEHALAAGEFSRAGTTTGDPEALRTLKLLEQHHKKLAQLLKFQSSRPLTNVTAASASETTGTTTEGTSNSAVGGPTSHALSTKTQSSLPYKTPHQPPTLPLPHRAPPRDLSSSIASNLASARGIPPSQQQRRGAPVSPTLSAQHAGGNVLNPSSKVRLGDRKPDPVPSPNRDGVTRPQQQNVIRPPPPPVIKPPATTVAVSDQDATRDAPIDTPPVAGDDPFQRFYSTFENLISKLSGPLAFAGLPLDVGDSKPKPEPAVASSKPVISQQKATIEPDLTRLFSRSALRAIREGNAGFNGGESFYVVPSTGGTISYAGILSRAEQEAGLTSADTKELGINANDNDMTGSHGSAEFVDARETPQPASPAKKRGRRADSGIGTKTMEELHLENQALKQLSDTLSRRLHMWEVNAQSSSLALQQSLRALRDREGGATNSPTQSEAGGDMVGRRGSADRGDRGDRERAALAERIRELEEEMRRGRAEAERFARENERLRVVVGRYRERWERLKEGARGRRVSGGNGNGNGGAGDKDKDKEGKEQEGGEGSSSGGNGGGGVAVAS
ncbi:hypothetical protein FGG08_001232 [Glutinoglossum americanum]|uniref:Uncharacterized protein n=1 Tax=Glutinoglossum americanum TaxID=1670608 RepID=A0A9P8IH26_9PEZI|nr:hypothetical protein FGG08_001232 [Glutinoglossum americanum]